MKNTLSPLMALLVILSLHGCATTPDATRFLQPKIDTGIAFKSSFGEHEFSLADIRTLQPEFIVDTSKIDLNVEGRIIVKGHPYDLTPSFKAVVSIENSDASEQVFDVSNIQLTGVSKLHTYGIEDTLKALIALTLIESKVRGPAAHDKYL